MADLANRNWIQYIAKSHTSKDGAIANKTTCNKDKSVYHGYKTFEQIVEIHNSGRTIARTRPYTEFLILDIDNSPIDIHTVDRFLKQNFLYDTETCYSSTRNDRKFHIFVKLNDVVNCEAYKDKVVAIYNQMKLTWAFSHKDEPFFELDPKSTDFYHCFFGPYTDKVETKVFHNLDAQLKRWVKKGCNPEQVADRPKELNTLPSWTIADYCKKHNIGILAELKASERFDIFMPWMCHNQSAREKALFEEGTRYNCCLSLSLSIAAKMAYNNNCPFIEETKWTAIDVARVVKWALPKCVENPETFTEVDSLATFAAGRFESFSAMSIEELCKSQTAYVKQYKRDGYISKAYRRERLLYIEEQHRDGDVLVFESCKELQEVAYTNWVSAQTVRNYCKAHCLELVIVEKQHRGGRVAKDWNSECLGRKDGKMIFPKKLNTNTNFRKWLKQQNIVSRRDIEWKE